MTDLRNDLPVAASLWPHGAVSDDGLAIPDYLVRIYTWAYLSPRWVPLLDHRLVIEVILWGNGKRLMNAAVNEFEPGQSVLQPASVYGSFSRQLAAKLGHDGHLQVADIAPIQVGRCRRKLAGFSNAVVRQANAASPVTERYDGVCCFFLLHEVPDDYKTRIVDALLAALAPDGKLVFVDYHRPHRFHPLRPVMAAVFRWLEPFANSLLAHEIRDFATAPEAFEWSKQTCFGGLYQKVVVRRRTSPKQ